MDETRFDGLTRSLARSRRSLLGAAIALAGGPLTLLSAEAKKKRKKKKRKPKKPQPNAFGCLNVSQPCNGDSTKCCSGICEGTKPRKGKPDKSRCMAHDTSICTAETEICSTGMNKLCDANNGQCGCVLTTGDAGFCGDFSENSGSDLCRKCSQDTDCQEEFGPGAACVVFGGVCESYCPQTGGTACVPACNDA